MSSHGGRKAETIATAEEEKQPTEHPESRTSKALSDPHSGLPNPDAPLGSIPATAVWKGPARPGSHECGVPPEHQKESAQDADGTRQT